eukprot:Sdes_comp18302_c0_seq1m8005
MDSLSYLRLYMNFTQVSDDDYNQLVNYSNWMELKRYQSDVVGSIAAGPFVKEISDRLTQFQQSPMKQTTIDYFSSHYPAILSLFTALQLDISNPDLVSIVPDYGSLIVFEFYPNASSDYLRILFRNGAENSSVLQPLNLSSIPGCFNDTCPLDSFQRLIPHMNAIDAKSWCNACSNNSSDLCRSQLYQDSGPSITPASCADHFNPILAGFIGALVALASSSLCMLGLWKLKCSPKNHYKFRNSEL